MKHTVTIEELFCKEHSIETDSPETALSIVKTLYDEGEIELDDSDFAEVTFGVDAPGPTEEFQLDEGYILNEVFVEENDARTILSSMKQILGYYGTVTVADYYDLTGKGGKYSENAYGWKDLTDAKIILSENGCKLSLPRALPLGVDSPTYEFPNEKVSLGDISCPVCGQTLIPLEPYDEDNVRDYWCDKCNIDIHITINEKEID